MSPLLILRPVVTCFETPGMLARTIRRCRSLDIREVWIFPHGGHAESVHFSPAQLREDVGMIRWAARGNLNYGLAEKREDSMKRNHATNRWLGFAVVGAVWCLFAGTMVADPSLDLKLSLEDDATAHLDVTLSREFFQPGSEVQRKEVRALSNAPTGKVSLDLAGLEKVTDLGSYILTASSAGYGTQWQRLPLVDGLPEPSSLSVRLFRNRYVVMRWVLNRKGRQLTGKDTEQGRCATLNDVPDSFQKDWSVRQASACTPSQQGPYIVFHRTSAGDENWFGFAQPPRNVPFEALKEAPPDKHYRASVCPDLRITKGLILFCRVEGWEPSHKCYAKILIEDITETPPPGIECRKIGSESTP